MHFFLHTELGLNPTKLTIICCFVMVNFPTNFYEPANFLRAGFSYVIGIHRLLTLHFPEEKKIKLAIQKLIKTYSLIHGNKKIAERFHNLCSFKLKLIILKYLTLERSN